MCRIITASELQNKTDIELSALFRKVSQQVTKSEPGTPERRNALASLENIQRVINTRYISHYSYKPKPPGF